MNRSGIKESGGCPAGPRGHVSPRTGEGLIRDLRGAVSTGGRTSGSNRPAKGENTSVSAHNVPRRSLLPSVIHSLKVSNGHSKQ